jgi:hypothetical protein
MTTHHSAGRRGRDTTRRPRRRQSPNGTRRLGFDRSETQPPKEPVIFLTPWQRFGLRRIYVMDEFGTDGGYFDLRTGELTGTKSISDGVFRQVLPEMETRSGGIGIPAEDWAVVEEFVATDTEDDRYVAEPLVVGCRLQSKWMDRLYVRRLTPGAAKIDLGWIDLTDGRIQASQPGAEAVIRYCGRTYQVASEPKD